MEDNSTETLPRAATPSNYINTDGDLDIAEQAKLADQALLQESLKGITESDNTGMPGVVQRKVSNINAQLTLNNNSPGAKQTVADGMETQQHVVYVVEHLASFPQDLNTSYLTPSDALKKIKQISSNGAVWAQKMHMVVSNEGVRMSHTKTNDLIEGYPSEQISLCISILDDDIFENLLIFTTKVSKDKVGAVHLFQCADQQVIKRF